MRRYDVIVIGCGAMGSSASYSLTNRGLRVLTLEQFQLAHGLGSSHGKTRVTRSAYYEDPRYVPLLKKAFSLWRDLERQWRREIMRLTGGLMIGPEDGEVVPGVLASARSHGLPHRKLSAKEAEEEFPAFKIEDGYSAIYEDNAGILFPEECVRAFVELARKDGCEFKFGEKVRSWNRNGDALEVRTDGDVYSADKMVLCAGAWTGKLLGGILPLTVERQVPFWFSSGGEARYTTGQMPVFIMEESPGQFYYGIPDVGHGVKVARHHQGATVDPDKVNSEVTEADSAPVERFVSKILPGLKLPHESATTCLYTNTPDLNFALGLHPEDSDLTVISACSGHGFKFASVMGEIAADLATAGKSGLNISFLGLDRFLG